jgi:Domain of unknown function (DUF4349)
MPAPSQSAQPAELAASPSAPRTRRRPPSRTRALAALVVGGCLVAGLGACSAGSDDAGGSTSRPADGVQAPGTAEDAPADGSGGALDDGAGGRESAGGSAGGDPAVAQALHLDPTQLAPRDIIRTGSVSIVATDPADTRDRIAGLVSDLGGYVSDESARIQDSGDVDEIRVVLQVPTGRFDVAVERISALGQVTSRSIQAQDVTGAVADVDSRVDTARAALDRIRALLDRATSLGTVIRLEGVLSNRQADLESLLAQQAALAGQTSLGTLEVAVRGKHPATAPNETEEAHGFLDGLKLGWDGLHDAYVGASTVVGAVLPFAVLAALLAVPVLVWRRRRVSPQQVAPAGGQQ